MTDTEPAGLADERFAANLRDGRERLKLSQAEVARQMAERGWQYHPQTVQRIEAGHRKIGVGEAHALARILHTTVDRLMLPGREASAAGLLDTFTARTLQAHGQIARWTRTLLFARRQLETSASEAERAGFHNSERIRELVTEAREALSAATPETALADGMQDYQDIVDGVAGEAEPDCPPLLNAEATG